MELGADVVDDTVPVLVTAVVDDAEEDVVLADVVLAVDELGRHCE